MIFHAILPTHLGEILLASDGDALTGVYFVGQKDCPVLPGLPGAAPEGADPRAGVLDGRPIAQFRMGKTRQGRLLPDFAPGCDGPHVGPITLQQANTPVAPTRLFEEAREELGEYFSGNLQVFTVPLHLNGTPFQRRIWEVLLRIPYGEVVSYGELAVSAGFPSGHARAAGMAVGRNPLTILIPCHRVLARNGTLNGYTSGLARKLALLRLEGLDPLTGGSYPAS